MDAAAAPRQTIIHVKDWHLVARSRFATDLRESLGPLSDEEFGQAYECHLQDVEAVQREQLAMLRQLITDHGLEAIYYEGLTLDDALAFEITVKSLRQSAASLPSLQADLRDTRAEIQRLERAGHQVDSVLRELEETLESSLLDHRVGLLRIGAAGQLYLAGEISEVLPLDDEAAHLAAEPVSPNGQIVLDTERIEAREDAQVQILRRGGAVVVAVLGGAHDLSDNVSRLGEGRVDLRVVEPQAYRSVATAAGTAAGEITCNWLLEHRQDCAEPLTPKEKAQLAALRGRRTFHPSAIGR